MKRFVGFDFVVQRTSTPSQPSYAPRPSTGRDTLHEDPLKRPPKHRWTTQERTILCLLERWYLSAARPTNRINTIDAIRRLFIVYFTNSSVESQITRAGLSNGAIVTQLAEIWQEGLTSPAWRNSYVGTDFGDENGHWTVTRSELKDLAAELGIVLTEKEYENMAEVDARRGNGLKKKKRKARDVDPGVLGNLVDHGEDTEDGRTLSKRRRSNPSSSLLTPYKLRQQHRQPTGLLTPPNTPKKQRQEKPDRRGHTGDHLSSSSAFVRKERQPFALDRYSTPNPLRIISPPSSPYAAKKGCQFRKKNPLRYKRPRQETCGLAFRAWDDNSQGINTPKRFIAGAFAQASAELPPPPDQSSEVFKNTAAIHLSQLEKPTCLISVTTSPLRPLNRCLRSTANGNISIIDMEYIKHHNPWPHPRLYSAWKVFRQLGILGISSKTGQEYRFSGASEFLVWGQIEPEAILSVFTKAELLEYSKSHPEIWEILRLATFQEATSSTEYNDVLKATIVNMDKTTGHAIGYFFGCILKLPLCHIKPTALRFAQSFMFEGNHSSQPIFIAGVEAGYHAYLRQLLRVEHLPSVTVAVEPSDKPWNGAEEDFDGFLKNRQRIQHVLELNNH